ncbi:MAG TPA: hypothetical protein VLA66_13360, partial [Thermoanaerobaculia bacterium]|nr:hypothetical protein [Thermoanaerobaculia bacterium]
FAAVLPELRDLMDPDLYLSVSLSRRDLELEGLSERLRAVDFTVAFLYGQRPGEKEDSAAWDLLAVERAAGRLEEIGRPYYLAASIVGVASWRGRGGETKVETTELDLASLVREDRLELKRGFTLEGIDRQVYEFRARGPVTVGSWKLAASDSVRVVRAATTNIEELLRRAQAWRGERRLGVLFWRLPSGTERLSMTASNVADALAPEPARPALDVLIERSESRRETWVLSVTLDNRNDESTDLAFFDSNYVDLAVRGGRIADVDPGDFARFELSRDGERATMRALREADKVRLFAPLVEGKQKLVSGPIVFVRGEGAQAILSSGRFILTDGEMLDLELREWSFGGDR